MEHRGEQTPSQAQDSEGCIRAVKRFEPVTVGEVFKKHISQTRYVDKDRTAMTYKMAELPELADAINDK